VNFLVCVKAGISDIIILKMNSQKLRNSMTEGDLVEIESGGSEELVMDCDRIAAPSIATTPNSQVAMVKRATSKSVRIASIPETIGHADERVDRTPTTVSIPGVVAETPNPDDQRRSVDEDKKKKHVHHASFSLHAHKRGQSETGEMFMGMTLKNLSIRDEKVHRRVQVKLGFLSSLFGLPFENGSLERNYIKICFASARLEQWWFSVTLIVAICLQLGLQMYKSETEPDMSNELHSASIFLKCAAILLCFVIRATEHFLLLHLKLDWMNAQTVLFGVLGSLVASFCSIDSTTNSQLKILAYANLLLFFALGCRFGAVQFHRTFLYTTFSILCWILVKVVLLNMGYAVNTGGVFAAPETAVLIAILALCLDSLYHYESTTRTNFVNFYSLKADQKDLENEKKKLIIQVQNLVLKTVGDTANRVDVSSPLERAVKILAQILEVPNLSDVVFSSVQEVLTLISDSSKLLQPDFISQKEAGKEVDKDIAVWLKDVFALQDLRVKHRISGAKENPLISMTQLLLENQRKSIFDSLDAAVNIYDFDVFKIDADSKGRPLFFTGVALLRRLGVLERYKIDEQKLENFLNQIEKGYEPHAYHNALHGTEVGHAVYHFITKTRAGDYLSELDIFASVIGGLCHDFRHPVSHCLMKSLLT
jgi:hypothetical protein